MRRARLTDPARAFVAPALPLTQVGGRSGATADVTTEKETTIMELFKASSQWATRPDDERFATIADLHTATNLVTTQNTF